MNSTVSPKVKPPRRLGRAAAYRWRKYAGVAETIAGSRASLMRLAQLCEIEAEMDEVSNGFEKSPGDGGWKKWSKNGQATPAQSTLFRLRSDQRMLLNQLDRAGAVLPTEDASEFE